MAKWERCKLQWDAKWYQAFQELWNLHWDIFGVVVGGGRQPLLIAEYERGIRTYLTVHSELPHMLIGTAAW